MSLPSSATHKLSSTSALRKPYLGWRSQENISDCHSNTPSQRLAYSLRKSKQSGSLNSVLVEDSFCQTPSDWYIQDSIKSVSCAITEFCNAGDVPSAHTSQDDLLAKKQRNRGKCRDHKDLKPKVVWLESSFVSLKDNPNYHHHKREAEEVKNIESSIC